MTQTPLLSVLMPNYNNEPYLKEALESVLNQSYSNFIVYFVDDCSTDRSIEIAKSFNDKRIKIFEKQTNSGIVDTMNVALDEIETKYFIRMDGDDISAPDRFKILLEYMESHPEIGVCSSDIRTFGSEEEVLTYGREPEFNKASLIFRHSVGHASSIFKTEIFKKNGIRYVDRFWRMEDYYLFYQLKNYTNTISISPALYLYRKGEYNSNHELMEKKRLEFYEFYKMVLQDLGIQWTEDMLKLHLQLSKREKATEKWIDYESHVELLKKSNEKNKLFPANALNKVLESSLQMVAFRLVENKSLNLKQAFNLNRRFSGLLRYFVSSKLKR